jgi:hypothetical protein
MDKVIATTPYGIFKVTRDNANATWSLTHETDLVVDAVKESDGSEKTVTFTAANYITFGGGGFIGIEDFEVNVIVRQISSDKLVATVFVHSYEPVATKPSIQLTMTFDAK